MIYAYYRVSTNFQDINAQRFGVQEFCNKRGLKVGKEIYDDGVSGCVLAKKRQLGRLLRELQPNDTLIVSELSRLGRKTSDILNTCQILIKKKISVYFVKNAIYLEDNPTSNMMITIFAAFSQLERDLIAQRTKEALAKKRADGVILGRPKGAKNKQLKLDAKIEKLQIYCARGWSKTRIAKKLHCSRNTLRKYLILHNILLD